MSCCPATCYSQFRFLTLSLFAQIIHAIIRSLSGTLRDFCFSGIFHKDGLLVSWCITTILPRYENDPTVKTEISDWFSSLSWVNIYKGKWDDITGGLKLSICWDSTSHQISINGLLRIQWTSATLSVFTENKKRYDGCVRWLTWRPTDDDYDDHGDHGDGCVHDDGDLSSPAQ